MTGEARAFRAERLLGDLDDHVLPFFQQLFDLRLWRLLFLVAAIACCVGVAAAAEDGVPGVALSDVARQVAAARTAAESDDASVEDRVRFATWALMVAEIAIEPHGLVSTASDLFDDGQDAIEELNAELAADPESQRAFITRSPLLAARLDAAVVRQERIAARRALAREEERKRLNDLRMIAKAFRAGLEIGRAHV